MTEYDNTNNGALFTPIDTNIIRQGKVNVEGTDKNMLIVKSKDREGMEYYKLYFESAIIYKTEKKKENDSDMDGTLNAVVDGSIKPMKFWLRKKTSAKGTDFTSVSLAPKTSNGGAPVQEKSINDMDMSKELPKELNDEIPF
jgi:hypothetical protein